VKRASLDVAIEILPEAVRMLRDGGHAIVGSLNSKPDPCTPRPAIRLVIESDLLPDECADLPLKHVSVTCRKLAPDVAAQIESFEVVK
jgi:hypothetical protein